MLPPASKIQRFVGTKSLRITRNPFVSLERLEYLVSLKFSFTSWIEYCYMMLYVLFTFCVHRLLAVSSTGAIVVLGSWSAQIQEQIERWKITAPERMSSNSHDGHNMSRHVTTWAASRSILQFPSQHGYKVSWKVSNCKILKNKVCHRSIHDCSHLQQTEQTRRSSRARALHTWT